MVSEQRYHPWIEYTVQFRAQFTSELLYRAIYTHTFRVLGECDGKPGYDDGKRRKKERTQEEV